MDADGKLQKKDEYFDDFDSDEFDSEATIANGVEPPAKAKDAQTLISDELLRYYNNPKVEKEVQSNIVGKYEVELDEPKEIPRITFESDGSVSEKTEDSVGLTDELDDIDDMPDDIEVDTFEERSDSLNTDDTDEDSELDIEFQDDDTLDDLEDISDDNFESTLSDECSSKSIVDSNLGSNDNDDELNIDFQDDDLEDIDVIDDDTSQDFDDTQGSQTYEVKNPENLDDAEDIDSDDSHDSLDDIDFQDIEDDEDIVDSSESEDETDENVSDTNDSDENDIDIDESDLDNSEDDIDIDEDDIDIDESDLDDSEIDMSDFEDDDADEEDSNSDKENTDEDRETLSEDTDELDGIDFQDLADDDSDFDDAGDFDDAEDDSKELKESTDESSSLDDIDFQDEDIDDIEEPIKPIKADKHTEVNKVDGSKNKPVQEDRKTIKKPVKLVEKSNNHQVDDEVAELERKLAEAKKRKELAKRQDKLSDSVEKIKSKPEDNSLEDQKRRAAQLAAEMKAKKQGRSSLDIPQKSIKKPTQSLLSENSILNKNDKNSLPQKRKLTRHEKYAQLTDARLMEYVTRFLQKNGVSKKPVDRKLLDTEFGQQNIQKLIKKSYLISIGRGITLGI